MMEGKKEAPAKVRLLFLIKVRREIFMTDFWF
jgi:hypothetical protein